MVKWGDVLRDVFTLVVGGRETVVTITGEVNDLQWLVLQQRDTFEERLVYAGSSLASAHDQQGAPIVFKPKRGQRRSPVQR